MKSPRKHGRAERNPRILIVTPEISYLPRKMGNMARHIRAKTGGLADVTASLVGALCELGADVHVALPHYRRMFHVDIGNFINGELRVYKRILPDSRIHLAQDRVFYYRNDVYSHYYGESHRVATAFQREVINNIIPQVDPDLIHCNDWMTGLLPAMARRMGIPALFTIHNIHTHELTLAAIEDAGIDAAEFWPYLFYQRVPAGYEETRDTNPIDLLVSGIFSAHFVNTVSPTFLEEICNGEHDFVGDSVRSELINKRNAGCATGILNAPDPSFDPETDALIGHRYSVENFAAGKQANKAELQERLGLIVDEKAPLLFWPSRLDPAQKGPQLLTHVLYDVVHSYWDRGLQIAVIANGPYQEPFRNVVRFHNFHKRVAICDFDEELSHIGYAASDFTLMPSLFEPCGLPQMIAAIYGSLPIAHDTGGLHDTVTHLVPDRDSGNGFLFEVFDPGGLKWAIEEAMAFYGLSDEFKARQISRIMSESAATFTHSVTAKRYFELYERMLKRPLINAF